MSSTINQDVINGRYYGNRTEAQFAEDTSERQPLANDTAFNGVTTPPSTATTNSPDIINKTSRINTDDAYSSEQTRLNTPSDSKLTAKQQRQQDELARRIVILGEQIMSPSDADFLPSPETHAHSPPHHHHAHFNEPATALEAALPALVEHSPQHLAGGQKFAVECKLYSYRYFILALFCSLSMTSAFQWLQYSIIQDIVKEFYGVTDLAVNWTSLLYMATYIPLIFPATWLLDKRGLRVSILAGAGLTFLGAFIKCFSARPHLFAVTFVGQTVSAIGQIFILGMPTQLAAIWFGPNEVSTACSVGVFGNQIGTSIGFLLPPLVVSSFTYPSDPTGGLSPTAYAEFIAEKKEIVAGQLFWLFVGVAVTTGIIFILTVLFFREKPPHPPSFAQARNLVSDTDGGGGHYMQDLIRLVKNRNFILLLISYGINTGVYYAVGTLLNPIILKYFPGKGKEAGLIGLTIVLSGLVGSVICGVILDKTKQYKLTTTVTYFCSLAGMVGFAFLLPLQQMWIAFLIAGALGFFMTGYLPVGFEFAAELTYPVQEGTSSGLLNASAQIFGIIFTLSLGAIQVVEGCTDCVLYGNIIMSVLLAVGLVLTVMIRAVLRRAQASMLFSKMVLDDTGNGMEYSSSSGNEIVDSLTRQNTVQNTGEDGKPKMFY